jgi:hypothetical protein
MRVVMVPSINNENCLMHPPYCALYNLEGALEILGCAKQF